MTEQHIAVVDDEPEIARLLAKYLGANGFRVTEMHDGRELMALMPEDPPDLVLLDIGLPGDDGLTIARHLSEHWQTRVILVTGHADPVDKVVGLEIGADDYVTKPFDLRELLARIRAVLRRVPSPTAAPVHTTAAAVPADCFHFAGWVLDGGARRLLNPDGNEVNLTSGEFDLMRVFVTHPGRVLSRDFLLEATRRREASPFDRAVDVLVGRLRKKIERTASQPQILKSVRTAGYVLAVPVQNAPQERGLGDV